MELERTFSKEKVVVARNFLRLREQPLWQDLQEELDVLEGHAKQLFLNPHSRYKQLLPEFMLRTPRSSLLPSSARATWATLDIYNLPEVHQWVKQTTGWKEVHQIPLRVDTGFEINGKINFYNADESSYLGWHYDRTDNIAGRQVVLVLCMKNSWDAAGDLPVPSLEYLRYESTEKRQIYIGGGDLSCHVPDAIFHRVLPFRRPVGVARSVPWKRIVLVMRFTENPQELHSPMGKVVYGVRNALGFYRARDPKWITITSASLMLLLALCAVIAVQGTRLRSQRLLELEEN